MRSLGGYDKEYFRSQILHESRYLEGAENFELLSTVLKITKTSVCGICNTRVIFHRR